MPKSAPACHLSTDGLACQRGQLLLWRGVSFSLHAGDALQIVGANGIGKSSLLRIIAGLLPPTHGTITTHVRAALIDEQPALDEDQPLHRALGFWATLDGSSASDVTAALDRTGIAHLAQLPLRFLSTGQRKRAAVARLLCSNAPLWLLDEPGNGLDHAGIALLETIITHHRANGGSVILASHLSLALEAARQIDLSAHQVSADAL